MVYATEDEEAGPAQPGMRLARGVTRALLGLGAVSVTEVVLKHGLRVDVMALCKNGEIWIVECKSSRADFLSDRKWPKYLEWCDRFFWAVDAAFPAEILPSHNGLIRADAWGGEVVHMPEAAQLAPARRKAVTALFARQAALRLQMLRDPMAGLTYDEV